MPVMSDAELVAGRVGNLHDDDDVCVHHRAQPVRHYDSGLVRPQAAQTLLQTHSNGCQGILSAHSQLKRMTSLITPMKTSRLMTTRLCLL